MSNFCGQCSGFESRTDSTSDCPFPGNSKDNVTCGVFEGPKPSGKILTVDDFPMKISDEAAAMFKSNRNTSRTIDRLMKALMIAVKDELHEPWELIADEVEGFAEFNSELIINNMCVNYDYVAKKIVIVKIK